jgi:DNA repair ATPase RecN
LDYFIKILQAEAQVKLTDQFFEIGERREIEFLIDNHELDIAFKKTINSNYLNDFEKEICQERIFEKFDNPEVLEKISEQIKENIELEEKSALLNEEEKIFDDLEEKINAIENENSNEISQEKVNEIEEQLEKFEEVNENIQEVKEDTKEVENERE